MAITTIPSRDLAKLVLGYLNEEQLMTVYDEMLQASPYLDASTNEYDRLSMQSLRTILNDYWRVKLCVEKCKPFALRKKLLQLQPNGLLDVVKFLISHVDLRKIPNLSAEDRIGLRTQQDICAGSISGSSSHNLGNNSNASQGLSDFTPLNTVDATSLTDLPGSTKRKQVKVLERDSSEAERLMSEDLSKSMGTNVVNYSCSGVVYQNTVLEAPLQCPNLPTTLRSPADNHLSVQNLDQILSATASKHMPINEYAPKLVSQSVVESITSRRTSAASFQEFATGVEAGMHVNMSIPDSSTSETCNLLPTSTVQHPNPQILSSQAPKSTQHLIRVNSRDLALVRVNAQNSPAEPKSSESKITIISDVKVENNQPSRKIAPKKPPVLQSSTPTPLLHMQTIMVNGTPAYKPTLQTQRTFTKAEIMDMPTIFLVTVTGPPPTINTVKTSKPKPKTTVSVTSSTNVVPSPGPIPNQTKPESPNKPPGETKNMPTLSAQSNSNLVTVIDPKNASVPKESTISKTSTPQCLPISMKSNSTPRRTSHIRVLDFTTPRRILQEAIGENGENPVEVILSQSPSTHDQPMSVESFETKTACETLSLTSASEDNYSREKAVCPPTSKKHNWDADLRAHCLQPVVETVVKRMSAKKKKPPENAQNSTESDKSTKKAKSTKRSSTKTKTKKTKKNDVVELPEKVPPEPAEPPVKPTINIVTDWHAAQSDKSENKSSGDNQSDTPDMNRTCLQNVIGAKLNISDFLETPYKQALYDIQMETPRFLRPDIPLTDEPVSEVKISDIPTPRFFDPQGFGLTPKPSQGATPSSYNSRPTDYSSGGSYYKPDEQDYIPHPDDWNPAMNARGARTEESNTSAEMEDKPSHRNTRPVRQCTKNVSYTNRKRPAKDATGNENSDDTVSITSVESGKEAVKDKVTSSTEKAKKPPKERRKSSSNKHKSPVKKTTPKFMKIKPRRPTPEKVAKRKSNTSESSQSRKRTSSKEKTTHTTPPVIPAPTKSRRKSSTPRKLHTKVMISPSPESSESVKDTAKTVELSGNDSDTENLPLRWSDDGSQDVPMKSNLSPVNEEEDISKIKDYIEKSLLDKSDTDKSNEKVKGTGSLHTDLVQRGFDIETARSIERDLLDSSLVADKTSGSDVTESNKPNAASKRNFEVEILDVTESDSSATNHLQIIPEEGGQEECIEFDEIELSTYECNEESNNNYFVSEYIESKTKPFTEHHTLKDNYTMEIVEEDLSVRLKATPWTLLIDEPKTFDENLIKETVEAVNSIPNFDRLYTPLKHHRPAPIDALIDVFDSSLTSLDTPLKAASPKNDDSLVSEVVIEVVSVEKDKGKGKGKKRRRIQSDSGTEESLNEPKRNRPEILPDIHNIDIESVLTQLHGP